MTINDDSVISSGNLVGLTAVTTHDAKAHEGNVVTLRVIDPEGRDIEVVLDAFGTANTIAAIYPAGTHVAITGVYDEVTNEGVVSRLIDPAMARPIAA